MADPAMQSHARAAVCHEDMGSDPCGKPAVGQRLDPEHGSPYPVCSEHLRPPYPQPDERQWVIYKAPGAMFTDQGHVRGPDTEQKWVVVAPVQPAGPGEEAASEAGIARARALASASPPDSAGPDTVERAAAEAITRTRRARVAAGLSRESADADHAYARAVVAAVGPVGRPEKPTQICLDCGAVGYAGGYHDHGDGNAGDTCSIAEVLRIVAEVGEVKDERDELRAALERIDAATGEG